MRVGEQETDGADAGASSSPRIFLSYRRDDAAGHAGRLCEVLRGRFGRDRVFMDIDTIAPGDDFVEASRAAVGSCSVLLALIGRRWLDCADAAGRRLDKPDDLVRAEIETALAQGVRVIPVLVQRAEMPRPEQLPDSLVALAYRNAVELSDARWEYDVGRLIEVFGAGLQRIEDPAQLQLPAPATLLIGRERELRDLRGLVTRRDVRLVTLTGPGGIGKTHLALELGRALAVGFADGVFFVDLAPITDPDLVVPSIAQVLSVADSGGSLIERTKERLRDKELLLLVDNFEQVVGGAAPLSDLLSSCPRVKLVVTSRAPLHLAGEQEYAVPPLALPEPSDARDLALLGENDAIMLFVERARAVKSDFALTPGNAHAVVGICAPTRRRYRCYWGSQSWAANAPLASPTAVSPRPAVEQVSTVTTVQNVVARSTLYPITASKAAKHVPASISPQEIIRV